MSNPSWPGPCSSCCDCPAPVMFSAQRVASKSKAGCSFLNSADGKYYLSQTTSTVYTATSSLTTSVFAGSTGSANATFSSTITYDPANCTTSTTCTGSGSSTGSNYNYDYVSPPNLPPPIGFNETCECSFAFTYNADCTWSSSGETDCTTVNNATGASSSGSLPGPTNAAPFVCFFNSSGGATNTSSTTNTTTYSDEYTDAGLEAIVLAHLPAWGALTQSTITDLASAELSGGSYSILESKYRFAHQLPSNIYYKLTWIERFTPDGGGSPTDMARSYTWDGARPPGFDPADPTTWPTSPVFEVDAPASNGEVTLESLAVTCTPSS